jgi:hypothetical protein
LGTFDQSPYETLSHVGQSFVRFCEGSDLGSDVISREFRLALAAGSNDDAVTNADDSLRVVPIQHATLALEWNGRTILVDPVGGAGRFQDLADPDLILVTDHHGDHLNIQTLKALLKAKTWLVTPSAVAEKLHRTYTCA